MLERVVKGDEAERRAIAEDVHDDPVQEMTAVILQLGVLKQSVSGPAFDQVCNLEQTVQTAIGRLRSLIFELYPPDLATEGGFQQALEDHLRRTAGDIQAAAELEDLLGPEPAGALTEETSAVAFRVALEALANIRKHSRAGHIEVRIEERDSGLLVRVHDDGVGFDPNALPADGPGHLGLASMRERVEMAGGSFEIRSAPSEGTVVEYWLPGQDESRLASVRDGNLSN